MMYCPVDILAIGAHPDDVELGCGGTLIKSRQQGKRIAIVDLTRGEMASRGTAEDRDREAMEAAEIIGVVERRNLDLGDGTLMDSQELRNLIAAQIRRYQPKVIIAPAPGDRHPDHDAAGKAVQAAAFYARLKNREILDSATGQPLNSYSPGLVLSFLMHEAEKPSFIVDITDEFEDKVRLVKAYQSQFFNPMPDDYKFVGTHDYLHAITARASFYGSMIQKGYAEAFLARSPLKIDDLTTLVTGKAGL